MTSSDPHGHHDWHSAEYVDAWIANDVTRDGDRGPLLARQVDLIPHRASAAITALDVGAGYGALSAHFLDRFPAGRLVAQDFSEPMFDHARRRLADHLDRVSFVRGDLREPSWTRDLDGGYDAVISALAIHNVRDTDRIRQVYEECAALLSPAGCFLNFDLVAVDDRAEQLDWLRRAGLQHVDCFWEDDRSAIIGGFSEDPEEVRRDA